VDAYRQHDWLLAAINKKLRQGLSKLQVELNEESMCRLVQR